MAGTRKSENKYIIVDYPELSIGITRLQQIYMTNEMARTVTLLAYNNNTSVWRPVRNYYPSILQPDRFKELVAKGEPISAIEIMLLCPGALTILTSS